MNGGIGQQARVAQHVDADHRHGLERFNRGSHGDALREMQAASAHPDQAPALGVPALRNPAARAFPKNTDITRGHTAACPNMETHFPWACDCHAREAATPIWLRELRRDKREQVL